MTESIDFGRTPQAPGSPVEALQQLASVAQPSAVFGAPATMGEYTLITASEALMGMGFGYGSGSQRSGAGSGDQEGGGGGGGGFSTSRPVAIISIGPTGVTVTPIVDTTKLALAALTAL